MRDETPSRDKMSEYALVMFSQDMATTQVLFPTNETALAFALAAVNGTGVNDIALFPIGSDELASMGWWRSDKVRDRYSVIAELHASIHKIY